VSTTNRVVSNELTFFEMNVARSCLYINFIIPIAK
jgi:hypothetical protein